MRKALLRVRVTLDEKRVITQAAQLGGTSLSELLRMGALEAAGRILRATADEVELRYGRSWPDEANQSEQSGDPLGAGAGAQT